LLFLSYIIADGQDKYFLIILIFGVLVAFYQAGLTVTQSAIIPTSVKNPPKSNRASYDLFGTIVFLVIYIVANAVFFAYIIKRVISNIPILCTHTKKNNIVLHFLFSLSFQF